MPRQIEITLPSDTLEDMKRRLKSTRWPPIIGSDDWAYGVPQDWLKEMTDYWLNEWQWDEVSSRMNRWPHYETEIDGIKIHYLHAAAKNKSAPPLILTHGWPWTFWDFKDVIGPLSDPESYGGKAEDAFNVFVPSLPGFGFSTPLTQPGIDVSRVADLWVKLMTQELGFERFAAHGGDWGALVTAHLAHAHADKLIGTHMSLTLIPGVDRASISAEDFSEDEAWMQARIEESIPLITSHVTVHRLDPQTLAYGLHDSPIATAAWIWERRRNWSDCDGVVENRFSKEHLCTTAAIFWCTGAITSSLRLYYEHFNKAWPLAHTRKPVLEAPCAFAVFPKDVVHMPRKTLEEYTNLQRYTVMPSGGHFGAAEEPELLIEDLRAFFHNDLRGY
jgi:pimeloyl-ACP methyl ester carboxylesterase